MNAKHDSAGTSPEEDLVTREIAFDAIDHVSHHNGPGREIEARAMLVGAAAPAPASQAASHRLDAAVGKVVAAFSAYGTAVSRNSDPQMNEAVIRFDEGIAAIRAASDSASTPATPVEPSAGERALVEELAAKSGLSAFNLGQLWTEARQKAPHLAPILFAYMVERAARDAVQVAAARNEHSGRPMATDVQPAASGDNVPDAGSKLMTSLWPLIEDYARKLHAVDYWSGSVKNSAFLTPAYAAKDALQEEIRAAFAELEDKIDYLDLGLAEWRDLAIDARRRATTEDAQAVRWLMPDGSCTADRHYGENYGGQPLVLARRGETVTTSPAPNTSSASDGN